MKKQKIEEIVTNVKVNDLQSSTQNGNGQLTTYQGLLINDNQNSLKAGERGATLLEDFTANGEGVNFLKSTYALVKDNDSDKKLNTQNSDVDLGLIINKPAKEFINAIAQHRFWDREKQRKVPA